MTVFKNKDELFLYMAKNSKVYDWFKYDLLDKGLTYHEFEDYLIENGEELPSVHTIDNYLDNRELSILQEREKVSIQDLWFYVGRLSEKNEITAPLCFSYFCNILLDISTLPIYDTENNLLFDDDSKLNNYQYNLKRVWIANNYIKEVGEYV